MRILIVEYNLCVRAWKFGTALSENGHEVEYLVAQMRPDLLHQVPRVHWFADTPKGLHDKLTSMNLEQFDAVQVANEPTWPVAVTRFVAPKRIPVVFDCHDTEFGRTGQAREDEEGAFAVCDAMVWPNPAYRALHEERWPRLKDIPAIEVPSLLTRSMAAGIEQMPKAGGIVYQGGTATSVRHRNLVPLVKACTDANIPFFLYSSNNRPQDDPLYLSAGAVLCKPLEYRTLLDNLTRYRWGFCGCVRETRQWNAAYSNKFWEYWAAGIPVLVLHAELLGRYVEEHGVGVHCKSIKDLTERYHEQRLIPPKLSRFMDDEVINLQRLYHEAKP